MVIKYFLEGTYIYTETFPRAVCSGMPSDVLKSISHEGTLFRNRLIFQNGDDISVGIDQYTRFIALYKDK